MTKTGIVDIKEALGNPARPTFATLPDKMRVILEKRAEKRRTEKQLAKLKTAAERQEQREKERPKRVKIELELELLPEQNDPPLDCLCPRAQTEKATRDKLKTVCPITTSS